MYGHETGLHIFKSYGVWTGIAAKRLGILLLFSFSFIFILGCMFTCMYLVLILIHDWLDRVLRRIGNISAM